MPTGGGLGVLAALEALLAAYRSPVLPDLPPLHGGVVGYLGYDVVREVEHLPDVPPDDQGFPDAGLVVIGQLAAFDHWRQRIVLIDNVVVDPDWTPDAGSGGLRRGRPSGWPPWPPTATGATRRRRARPRARRGGGRGHPHHTRQRRLPDAVAVAKEHIVAGDIFQVVLSQRFDLDLGADPFDVYRALRLLNPSPYLYFLRLDEVTVVGSSPEPMVRLRDGVVTSRPIAGSRPRGATEEQDRRLAGELVEDPKELAEHVMLVDLARNDVGRVVSFGTEQVDELMTVERYSHIMHLTSQVSGRLRPGQGADRRAAGHPARRHPVGGAQGAGHADHRRARAHQAGHLRRGGRLPRLLGQPGHRHRHPDHGGRPRRPGLGPGRGGHRGRQRPGHRGRGVRPQGGRPAGRGGRGPSDGRGPGRRVEPARARGPRRAWPTTTSPCAAAGGPPPGA